MAPVLTVQANDHSVVRVDPPGSHQATQYPAKRTGTLSLFHSQEHKHSKRSDSTSWAGGFSALRTRCLRSSVYSPAGMWSPLDKRLLGIAINYPSFIF